MNFIDTAAALTLESRIDTALQQRYREPVETIAPAANETLATLFNHRSVRAFLPEKLADGTLELLIAAAQSASTSSNIQAWSVVAVEDPEARVRLSAIAGNQQHIVDSPLVLVWVADLARIGDVAARRNTALEAVDFTEPFLVATIDAALAAQNAFVAAESLGLGATYIGALRNRPAEVAEIIGLPPRSYPVFGLVVGHPDPDRPTAIKPRLPQSAAASRSLQPRGAARGHSQARCPHARLPRGAAARSRKLERPRRRTPAQRFRPQGPPHAARSARPARLSAEVKPQ
jgi:nitroreductase